MTVLLIRRKVLGRNRNKIPKMADGGTISFEHPNDFGYASPEEIRKCKISTSDYTEPFTGGAPPPPLTTFPRSSFNPSMAGSGSGAGVDPAVGSNGNKRLMADYYICTLIPNSGTPAAGATNAGRFI